MIKPQLSTLLIFLCLSFASKVQNRLPNSGKVGHGTNSPKALLDVNGKAILRDTVDIQGHLFSSQLRDTSSKFNRLLGISSSGMLGYFKNVHNESFHASKSLRVGSNSMHLVEGSGGENYFYATGDSLQINPSISGVTLEDTYINPDGGSLVVGYPTSSTSVADASLAALSTAGSSICGKTNSGVAICSEVTLNSGILFKGSNRESSTNATTIEIDAFGKIWTWGGMGLEIKNSSLNAQNEIMMVQFKHLIGMNRRVLINRESQNTSFDLWEGDYFVDYYIASEGDTTYYNYDTLSLSTDNWPIDYEVIHKP